MMAGNRSSDGPISRRELLEKLGYGHPHALARASEILARAGIVNPKRDGMSATKRDAVRETLDRILVRLCDGWV